MDIRETWYEYHTTRNHSTSLIFLLLSSFAPVDLGRPPAQRRGINGNLGRKRCAISVEYF
jgi:hypothetical protein